MYKGTITTPTAVAANAPIPFVKELNTNAKTRPEGGTVNILTPGYWEIKAQVNLTGANGDIELQFYNGDEPIADTIWTLAVATSETVTATIGDVIRVVRAPLDLARISVRSNLVATVNAGVFIVEEIK